MRSYMKIYLNIIRPLLSWFRAKTNSAPTDAPPDAPRTKWILPTVTYVLTLITGIYLGTLLCHPQLRRYHQLTITAQNREKALLDSLRSITQLAEKDQEISVQNETILTLRQRLRSDSIAHLTELQAIRAINQHLKPKK